MLRLEEQVAELTAMSRIMADLLNDVLFDDREVEEGYSSIRISAQDMTNLAFAVNNVASRAGKLEAHYYAACSGEVGQ
nr:hypothetical protein [Sinorhizobium medicae]